MIKSPVKKDNWAKMFENEISESQERNKTRRIWNQRSQVSRSRVWSTTFNGAKRSVKRRTESACGIWKHDMFLAGASLWGVMGEDVILEKVIGCGKWKPGDGEHKKLKKFGCKVEERQWRFFPYVSCSTFVSHIVGDVTHTAFFLRNELIVFLCQDSIKGS